MRLSELEPRWWAEAGRQGQGVSFLCPHCRTVRLGVAFSNPLDGGPPVTATVCDRLRWVHGEAYTDDPLDTILMDVPPAGPIWHRTGETFEDLTLSPSVDAGASGHWHGFVSGGAVG